MPRIGITGHSNLTDATEKMVHESLRNLLLKHSPGELVGVTCLARGADQLFAQVVLDIGGSLEVILPAADYRTKIKPDNLPRYEALLAAAESVHVMPFDNSRRESYMAASEHMLSTVDEIIAVWDGGPSGGLGGTADVSIVRTEPRSPSAGRLAPWGNSCISQTGKHPNATAILSLSGRRCARLSTVRSHELIPGRTFGLAFDHGDDFFEALAAFCTAHNVRQGYIPMFLAGFAEAEIVGTCDKLVDPGAPVWSKVHLTNVEALGCGTLGYDPETDRVLPHIHTSLGLKERSAVGHTSHLLSARVQFLVEMLLVEIATPTMLRTREPALYDVPLLRFGS